MTKEEFLEDPTALLFRLNERPPVEWIATAWTNPEFRKNATYAMTRSVSKNGDFVVASFWLETLPAFFTAEDTLQLYGCIRDASGRLEEEWRTEFERAFAAHAAVLPPMRELDW
jgi:hypothetical protein